MEANKLETIQHETLDNVTGGGWMDMLSGGSLPGDLPGGHTRAGGGLFGTNGRGDSMGLSEGIASKLGLGGNGGFKAVEGKGR